MDHGAEVKEFFLDDAKAAVASKFRQYKVVPQENYERILKRLCQLTRSNGRGLRNQENGFRPPLIQASGHLLPRGEKELSLHMLYRHLTAISRQLHLQLFS